MEAAITALLTEPTFSGAAAKAGVGEATLRSWLRQPMFADEYRKARRAALEAVIGQMARASTRAVRCLERNLRCGVPAVEVKAAQALADLALRAAAQDELERRVAELVQKLSAGEQNPWGVRNESA